MGREFELKYALTEDAFAAIRQRFGGFASIAMETVYYDTPDRDLGKLRWTLRRRLENGVSVCTFKTAGDRGGRGEWETQCGRIEEAIEPLVALGAPEQLKVLAAAGLVSTCGARFTRLAKDIESDGTRMELALDRGAVLGGSREAPLMELEVELKQGSEEEVRRFAGELAREFGLSEEPKSKFARARQLAEETP